MSNYEPLGKYIRPVDERNRDLQIEKLLGVSINKTFIPSIANTVGTDFRSYKIVRKGQFAYGPVTSRNGDKMSIALLNEDDCIISSSYSVFEVIDKDKLDPEYLMLWFSRPEFDRYARYMSHGSVREIFDWDELCKVELPVPNLDRQREIVKAYNVITERIRLKQKINDNLTATGVSLLSKEIGTAALINKTPDEINSMNVPDSWKIMPVSEYCKETKSGATPSRDIPEYWENGTIPWLKSGEVHNGITIETEEFITELAVDNSSTKVLPSGTVLMAMYGVTAGEVGYLSIPSTTNQAVCGMVCHSEVESAYLFFALLQNQQEASRLSNGGAQDNLSKGFIDNILVVVPSKDILSSLGLTTLINQIKQNTKEILLSTRIQDTLLAQLSSR